MALPDLSICIVSHNTRELLRDCLRSLPEACYGLDWEVIVADNGSQDGSVSMLREEFPHAQIIKNAENLGYTLPMNQALRMGKGRYLIQLNPDTLVKPKAFLMLVAYMDANPTVGIATPKVLNLDGSLQKQCRRSAGRPWDAISYFSGLSRLFPHSRFFGGYLMGFLPENEIAEVEAVSGSCMFIRRDLVEQIGYMDEVFFAYQEDADFCFRARVARWKIMYVPLGEVFHYGGIGGANVQVYRSICEWHKSYYMYYCKNLAKENFFLFNWLYGLAIGAKLILSLLKAFFSKDKRAGTRKP